MNFAVVIPAYNEEATIRGVAERARAQVNEANQVIVVDDGSADDTSQALEDLDVMVLRNESNLGKAGSLWRGMQYALEQDFDGVVTLDGDGQHQPEDIPRVLTAAQASPNHIIIASRLRHQENAPALRLFANRFANFWISWAAGYYIPDSQSGFRFYPAEVLRQVEVAIDKEHGFAFESEILIDAAWKGVRSQPVPIDSVYFKAARHSHYRAGADTLQIVTTVAKRLLRRGMYPIGLIRVLHAQTQRRLAMILGRTP